MWVTALDSARGPREGPWIIIVNILRLVTAIPRHADPGVIQDHELPDARAKIASEDQLLFARTGVFLTTNSFLLAILALPPPEKRPAFYILGPLVAVLWLSCSTQSARVLYALTAHIQGDLTALEKIVYNATWPFHWLKNTFLIGIVLPLMFLITWLILPWI